MVPFFDQQALFCASQWQNCACVQFSWPVISTPVSSQGSLQGAFSSSVMLSARDAVKTKSDNVTSKNDLQLFFTWGHLLLFQPRFLNFLSNALRDRKSVQKAWIPIGSSHWLVEFIKKICGICTFDKTCCLSRHCDWCSRFFSSLTCLSCNVLNNVEYSFQ